MLAMMFVEERTVNEKRLHQQPFLFFLFTPNSKPRQSDTP
jgi:hypothetical protein